MENHGSGPNGGQNLLVYGDDGVDIGTGNLRGNRPCPQLTNGENREFSWSDMPIRAYACSRHPKIGARRAKVKMSQHFLPKPMINQLAAMMHMTLMARSLGSFHV
jgi:hypothetical protein